MLGILKQYFWNRRRLIFRFNDGTSVRAIDPIEVAIVLHEHPSYLRQHLHEARNGDHDAQMIVARAACEAFNVSPFNGFNAGLTISERIELMIHFDAFLLALKKNIKPSLTPQSSTESTSQPSSEPITKSSSESGSTGSDHTSDKPTSTEPDGTPPPAS